MKLGKLHCFARPCPYHTISAADKTYGAARIAAANVQVERTTRQMHGQELQVESPPKSMQASYVDLPAEIEAPRSAKKRIDFGIKQQQDSPGTLLQKRVATEESVRRAIPLGEKNVVPVLSQHGGKDGSCCIFSVCNSCIFQA